MLKFNIKKLDLYKIILEYYIDLYLFITIFIIISKYDKKFQFIFLLYEEKYYTYYFQSWHVVENKNITFSKFGVFF